MSVQLTAPMITHQLVAAHTHNSIVPCTFVCCRHYPVPAIWSVAIIMVNKDSNSYMDLPQSCTNTHTYSQSETFQPPFVHWTPITLWNVCELHYKYTKWVYSSWNQTFQTWFNSWELSVKWPNMEFLCKKKEFPGSPGNHPSIFLACGVTGLPEPNLATVWRRQGTSHLQSHNAYTLTVTPRDNFQ